MGARDREGPFVCSAMLSAPRSKESDRQRWPSVPNSNGSRSNASARQHWRSFCTAETALLFLQNSLACRKDQQTVAPRVVRVHHLQATRHASTRLGAYTTATDLIERSLQHLMSDQKPAPANPQSPTRAIISNVPCAHPTSSCCSLLHAVVPPPPSTPDRISSQLTRFDISLEVS